jgi:hypothetical protein
MNSSTRLALILGLQLCAGAAFLACGEDDPAPKGETVNPANPDDKAPNDTVVGTLTFVYSQYYSGFVEGKESTVPVLLKDAKLRTNPTTWDSTNKDVATVTSTPEGALVTVKKEGETKITAKQGDDSGAVKLTVTKYSAEEHAAGEARFSKSVLAINAPAGQALNPILLASPMGRNPDGACNTCHTSQAKLFKIENGPLQTSGYTEEEIIQIFTEGEKPDGARTQSDIPPFLWGMFHAWNVTEGEKKGLVAYLRTQQPRPSPNPIDYGVMPCDGGLCDRDGKPISFPGQGGRNRDAGGGGTTTPPTTSTDAGGGGTTTPPTTSSDAGGGSTTDSDAGV